MAYAFEEGAPAVEAYPVDSAGEKVDLTMAYVGTRRMCERAGFRKVADTASTLSGFPRGADAHRRALSGAPPQRPPRKVAGSSSATESAMRRTSAGSTSTSSPRPYQPTSVSSPSAGCGSPETQSQRNTRSR